MKPNIKSRSREDQKNMMREKYITTFFPDNIIAQSME